MRILGRYTISVICLTLMALPVGFSAQAYKDERGTFIPFLGEYLSDSALAAKREEFCKLPAQRWQAILTEASEKLSSVDFMDGDRVSVLVFKDAFIDGQLIKNEWKTPLLLDLCFDVLTPGIKECFSNLKHHTELHVNDGYAHTTYGFKLTNTEYYEAAKKLDPNIQKLPPFFFEKPTQLKLTRILECGKKGYVGKECQDYKGWKVLQFDSPHSTFAGSHKQVIIYVPGEKTDHWAVIALLEDPPHEPSSSIDIISVVKPTDTERAYAVYQTIGPEIQTTDGYVGADYQPKEDERLMEVWLANEEGKMEPSKKFSVQKILGFKHNPKAESCIHCHPNGVREINFLPGILNAESEAVRQEMNRKLAFYGAVDWSPFVDPKHFGPAFGAGASCVACHSDDFQSARARNILSTLQSKSLMMQKMGAGELFSMPTLFHSSPSVKKLTTAFSKIEELSAEDKTAILDLFQASTPDLYKEQYKEYGDDAYALVTTLELLKVRGKIEQTEFRELRDIALGLDKYQKEQLAGAYEEYRPLYKRFLAGGSENCITSNTAVVPASTDIPQKVQIAE